MNKKLLFFTFITFYSINFLNAQTNLIRNFADSPSNFCIYKDKLYFAAGETSYNRELWVYDAAIALSSTNPKLVADLNDDQSSSSYPKNLVVYNGKLFFSNNFFLYSYNSEEPISTTNPKKIGKRGNGLVVYNQKLYYEDASEYPKSWIWVYDDTQSIGATNPKKLNTDLITNSTSLGFRFKSIVFNNKLYYCGSNANDQNFELYVYDSNAPISGTNPKKVSEINPGKEPSTPNDFLIWNNKLYFTADDGTGAELWSYDEINAPVKEYDIDPSAYGGIVQYKTLYNGKLYFSGHNSLGTELWRYDDVNKSELVSDIYPGNEYATPRNLTVHNNKLFFDAENGTKGRELWYYDSTIPNSSTNPKLIDLFNGSASGRDLDGGMIEYNNTLYFAGKTSNANIGLFSLNDGNLSIDDHEKKSAAVVYPNPTSGNLTIESNGEVIDLIKVTNSLGQEVSTIYPNNTKQLLTLKSKGLYIIQIKTSKGTETQKILVN